MKDDHLKYVVPLTVGILLGMDCIQPKSAQPKSISLINLPCTITRTTEALDWGSAWVNIKEDVVLNREFHSSLMRIYASDREFACKLPNAKSASLDLEVGIPSNEAGPALLTVYLNGDLVASEKVIPGKVTLIKKPLVSEIGGKWILVIETSCLKNSCGDIRFFKANLNVVGNPGGKE